MRPGAGQRPRHLIAGPGGVRDTETSDPRSRASDCWRETRAPHGRNRIEEGVSANPTWSERQILPRSELRDDEEEGRWAMVESGLHPLYFCQPFNPSVVLTIVSSLDS